MERVEKVYPFWPAQVRLNTTPAGGIRGRLVYCGNASFQEIHPAGIGRTDRRHRSLGGAGLDAGQLFRRLRRPGSGQSGHRQQLCCAITTSTCPWICRAFICPTLRPWPTLCATARSPAPATLVAQAHWESKTARNLYALIQPPLQAALDNLPLGANWAMSSAINPGSRRLDGAECAGALAISVPLESSGLVPDLAVGASQAVQTAAGAGPAARIRPPPAAAPGAGLLRRRRFDPDAGIAADVHGPERRSGDVAR